MATSPGVALRRLPMARSLSTNRRLRDSSGSWKFGLSFRQSSSGSLAIRSRVIAPVSSPDAMGE